MTELKPCPFCGGEAKIYKYAGSDTKTGFVACSRCGIGTECWMVERAIEMWERRVKE